MLNENYYTEFFEIKMWNYKEVSLSKMMMETTGKIFPTSVISSNGNKIKISFKEDKMILQNEEECLFSIKVWVILSKIDIEKIINIDFENEKFNYEDWFKEKKNE